MLDIVVNCKRKERLEVFLFDLFRNKIYSISTNTTNSSVFFKDKLRNMMQYSYKAIVCDQPPRLSVYSLENRFLVVGVDLLVLYEICILQNDAIKFQEIDSDDPKFLTTINKALPSETIDFTLNTMHTSIFNLNSFRLDHINTFDENGYCALGPIPKRLTFLDFILSPYDAWSWSCMIISIVICGVFCNILNRKLENSDSGWRFTSVIAVNFVGQSIPFRNSRPMQMTLLQLCIMMTFIMGNAYQSLIIASMTTSRQGVRMKTISELFKSDFKMKVDRIAYLIFQNSGDFTNILNRMEIGKGTNYKTLIDKEGR